MQFVFLRKVGDYEKVMETCLEYADYQRVFPLQGEKIIDQARSKNQEGEKKTS